MTTDGNNSDRSSHSRSAQGSPRGARRPRRPWGRRKVCQFCVDKQSRVDYKSVGQLRRYLSERSSIEAGRRTGNCARHQRMVRQAIKRSRFMALLPMAETHLRITNLISEPTVNTDSLDEAESEEDVAESKPELSETDADSSAKKPSEISSDDEVQPEDLGESAQSKTEGEVEDLETPNVDDDPDKRVDEDVDNKATSD